MLTWLSISKAWKAVMVGEWEMVGNKTDYSKIAIEVINVNQFV
jgi:hypothetical protein